MLTAVTFIVFHILLIAYLLFLWNFITCQIRDSLNEQKVYVEGAERRMTCLLMWIRAKKRNMVNGTSWDGRSRD